MAEPLSSQTPPADVPSRPGMSFGARLVNIFATPGEVFEEVRERPPAHANWWVPTLLLCLAGIISAWVIFSQPAVLQKIREAKEKALEKQLAHLPAAQREQAMDLANKVSSPIVLKAVGTMFAVVTSSIQLFGTALMLWAIGVVLFKSEFSYLKAMEVAGLAVMIPVLGRLLTMLLIVITGDSGARLSPAALLPNFDSGSPAGMMLGAVNVIQLWYLGLLALGLGKLSRRSALVPALCFYGFYLLYHLARIALTLLAQRIHM